MTKIVGIRFRNVGKIYYFDPKNYKMQVGDHVIIMCYCQMTPEEAKDHKPKVVFVDEQNHISRVTSYEKHGQLS